MALYIAKGKYGAISYNPRLRCEEELSLDKKTFADISQGQVSKLTDGESAKNENTNYKIVDKLDNNEIFHIKLIKNCKPAINTQKIKEFIDDNDYINPQLLIFNYGGSEINISAIKKFNDCMNYITGLLNVYYGINQLNKISFIHHDINIHNIVFENNRGRLVDFGLSSTYNNFYKDILDFAESVSYWPPEVSFFINLPKISTHSVYNSHYEKYFFNSIEAASTPQFRKYIKENTQLINDKYNYYNNLIDDARYEVKFGNPKNIAKNEELISFLENIVLKFDGWSLAFTTIRIFTQLKAQLALIGLNIEEGNFLKLNNFIDEIIDFIVNDCLRIEIEQRMLPNDMFKTYTTIYIKYFGEENIQKEIKDTYDLLISAEHQPDGTSYQKEHLERTDVYNIFKYIGGLKNRDRNKNRNKNKKENHHHYIVSHDRVSECSPDKSHCFHYEWMSVFKKPNVVDTLTRCKYKPSNKPVLRRKSLKCATDWSGYPELIIDELNRKTKRKSKYSKTYKNDLRWLKNQVDDHNDDRLFPLRLTTTKYKYGI